MHIYARDAMMQQHKGNIFIKQNIIALKERSETMNDYAFVLDKKKKCEEIQRLLSVLLVEKQCKFIFMDEVYEFYCTNKNSKPNQKKNQKHGYDFNPEKDCVECHFYQTRTGEFEK